MQRQCVWFQLIQWASMILKGIVK